MLLMIYVIYNRETVAVSGKYVAEEVISNLFYQKVSLDLDARVCACAHSLPLVSLLVNRGDNNKIRSRQTKFVTKKYKLTSKVYYFHFDRPTSEFVIYILSF